MGACRFNQSKRNKELPNYTAGDPKDAFSEICSRELVELQPPTATARTRPDIHQNRRAVRVDETEVAPVASHFGFGLLFLNHSNTSVDIEASHPRPNYHPTPPAMAPRRRRGADAAEEEPQPQSDAPKNKPPNTAFRQQRMKAWQCVLTPKLIVTIFSILAAIYLGFGAYLTYVAHTVRNPSPRARHVSSITTRVNRGRRQEALIRTCPEC